MLDKVSMSAEIRKLIVEMEATIEEAKKHKQMGLLKNMIAAKTHRVKRLHNALYKAALKSSTRLPTQVQEKLILEIQSAM